MSDRPQKSAWFLVLTIAGAVVLICVAALLLYETKPEVEAGRKRLVGVREEYFGIEKFVKSNIDELNDGLTEFLQTQATADLARFEKTNQKWEQWLEQQRKAWPEEALAGSGSEPPDTDQS